MELNNRPHKTIPNVVITCWRMRAANMGAGNTCVNTERIHEIHVRGACPGKLV